MVNQFPITSGTGDRNGMAKMMKNSEAIQAFGAGINDIEMIPLFLEHFELDFFLVAMPYTLLNQETLEDIFPECERRGIGVIIGSPYASGILASGFRKESKYGYAAVSEEMLKKVQSIEVICEDHGIPLKAAALQFHWLTLKFRQSYPVH